MRPFALVSVALLATVAAGSNAWADRHRSHVRVGVVVGSPYYYGGYGPLYRPYYWPSYYGPYYGPYGGYGYSRDPYATGAVRLKVHPKQARVLVDGYFAGTVDDFDGGFQQLDLKPGRHEITLK